MKMINKHKNTADKKSQISSATPKRAQEEMVGFAIIMVVVFVILLVFLSLSLRNKESQAVESYEVEAFIDSMLAFTTPCEDYLDVYESVQDLLFKHFDHEPCVNDFSTAILMPTLEGILNNSWNVGQNNSVKGYSLQILSGSSDVINLGRGNQTRDSKGSAKTLYRSRGDPIDITFIAYY
ncbi:MAG: hypothetical protein KKB31_01305 [Nanoarchaeota archaeon]|nr:hypothetical protein [Nanoarchaeota archaeon]